MSDGVSLVYLEADDEITAVVRRVRGTDAERVVVVAPGRSRATSSAVALRLLARVGADEGREVVVVGDALTRSLAAEAGLPAFAAVEEARAATLDAGGAPAEEPHHAAITVVRGEVADDTVARPLASPAPPSAPRSAGPTDETAAGVPVARPTPRRPARSPRGPRRHPVGLAAVLGVAGAVLIAAIVTGATLLPAATITIAPRTVVVEETYELRVEDATPQIGTVDAVTTVMATGTYEVVEPARGVVTFRNFENTTVEVPAGTLVAAGEQAFETTEAVAVPSGSLTSTGTIAAGEADAPVVAAAAGPAGNVAAGEIDQVLSQGVAARLRGFPQNTVRLVINAEPTTGGADATGPEITQEDVDAAVAALRAELRRLAAEESPEAGSRILVEPPAAEPELDVPDDLVGTRDQPQMEIGGSLAWEVLVVDPEPLEEEAASRLASDPGLPEDHELLQGTVEVDLADAVLEDATVVVEATVTGVAAPALDPDAVLAGVVGLTEAEAELALAHLGEVDVVLWPGWVEAVPDRDWRVDLRIEEPAP